MLYAQHQQRPSFMFGRGILWTPHAGQLRFHDFDKLRVQQQQRRSFFSNPLSKTMRHFQLKQLEKTANNNLNDAHAQYEFLKELSQTHPASVLARFKHPKAAAVDGNIALLYLRTLLQTGQVHQLNVDELLQRLERTTGVVAPQEMIEQLTQQHQTNKADQIRALQVWLSGGSGGATATEGASSLAAGRRPHTASPPVSSLTTQNSTKQPFYVSVLPSGTIRTALFSFVLRAALLLLGVSAVSALLDERGLGRGGFGGMNTNSKHVQEAESEQQHVKFDDVKGVAEAKAELEEIVLYLKDPSRFTRLGGKLPRGLLLTGPPGTGKTLLAKAIAGEANVPFFYSSGSQFEEVYVGLGAKRIRELFEAAKKKSPAIIFIDEIDAVGGTRKLKDQSALKMTLNELLVQLDGFDENKNIVVIGATNFVESLDTALLRPGRFDKHVSVPLPDVGGRKEILELYSLKTKLAPDVDLTVIARGTTGFSGADLFNLMNQAAVKAAVDGLPHVTMQVLEYAKDKILMGAERKTAVITPETAKCTAYHEAGHAIVAVLTEGAMPIHKATIMPRGDSLGMVTMLPEGDQTSSSRKEMLASMDVAMGGRVAEELIFGSDNVTSGASSDIRQATRMARNMVTKWGFSEEVGLVFHDGETGEGSASGQTRAKIDSEVKRLTDEAYRRAKDLLIQHKHEHKLLAETLLEYETLTGDEVRDLVKKRKTPKRPVIDKGAPAETTKPRRGLFGN